MERFTISLDADLAKEFDRLIAERGYGNRSEAVRDIIRAQLEAWRLKRDEVTSKVPVIMLTAKTTEDNKIQGLEYGADDYVTKPFAPRELAARIKAVLRRTGVLQEGEVLEAGGIRLDHGSHRVTVEGKLIDIGPTEYKLLAFFMAHQDRVYTRSQLLDQVWGNNAYIEERTIDVHIRRLRKALQCDGVSKDYGELIQTVRGAGYRFSTVA